MKKLLSILCFFLLKSAISQSIYLPSGNNGIGVSLTNNIGIGTSNPTELLQINGNLRGLESLNGQVRLKTNSGSLIIGPESTNCEFLTDVSSFYFNKPISTNSISNNSFFEISCATFFGINVQGNNILKAHPNFLEVQKEIQCQNDIKTNGSIWTDNDIRMLGSLWINYNNTDVNYRITPRNDFKHIYIDYSKNLYFRSNIIGSGISPLLLEYTGNVGIGFNTSYNPNVASVTQGYKLAVNGGILCEEVKVIADVPGADYVFEKDYPLLSLKNLESFIHSNKHLPEVPSAADFKSNGYKVGEMDNLLLRKIEELTIYLIEQQHNIQEQQAKISRLEQAIQQK